MEHTPGTWKAAGPSCSPLHDAGDYAIVDTDGAIIAETFRQVSKDGTRPAEANAKLIAASPDMLEALEEIAGYRGSLYDNPKLNDWAGVAMLLKERARKAIEAAS